jgi:hypothetical protein
MREKRNLYRLLVGKPEGKRPLGRPRRRWLDSIQMDLAEIGFGDVGWIGMESSCECGNESSSFKMLGNYRVSTQVTRSQVVPSQSGYEI